MLLATAELVAERGYQKTTIELIAKTARVALSTFYEHFSSKEECFLAAFDETIAAAGEVFAELLDPEQAVVGADLRRPRDLRSRWSSTSRRGRASASSRPRPPGGVALVRYQAMLEAVAPKLREGRESQPAGEPACRTGSRWRSSAASPGSSTSAWSPAGVDEIKGAAAGDAAGDAYARTSARSRRGARPTPRRRGRPHDGRDAKSERRGRAGRDVSCGNGNGGPAARRRPGPGPDRRRDGRPGRQRGSTDDQHRDGLRTGAAVAPRRLRSLLRRQGRLLPLRPRRGRRRVLSSGSSPPTQARDAWHDRIWAGGLGGDALLPGGPDAGPLLRRRGQRRRHRGPGAPRPRPAAASPT